MRRILNEHFNAHLQRGISFSWIATLFFQIYYLQYKINRYENRLSTQELTVQETAAKVVEPADATVPQLGKTDVDINGNSQKIIATRGSVMNKPQMIVMWVMAILLSVLSYPFFDEVMRMYHGHALILSLIVSVVLIGTALVFSLRNVKDDEVAR